jgi:hypothetical protein
MESAKFSMNGAVLPCIPLFSLPVYFGIIRNTQKHSGGPGVKPLLTSMLATVLLACGCKPATSSAPASTEQTDAPAQVSGSMCDRIGGLTGADGTCRCGNGVAAFKLLGQTCAGMLARQTGDCTAQGGQILYDDGRCRCFPDYEVAAPGSRCAAAYPQVATPAPETPATEGDSPPGACVIIERSSGKVQSTCFEQVDLEGCERSFQVAYNQLKPEQYEMVLHPQKDCVAAKAVYGIR